MTASGALRRLGRFGAVAVPAVALAMTIGACAYTSTGLAVAGDATTTSTRSTSPAPPTPLAEQVWAPAGSPPPVMLDHPADGSDVTVVPGQRVRIPESESLGGVQLRNWDGVLVPDGARGTFLAVHPGTVSGAVTAYDAERPCVPPQPVSEFGLIVRSGPAPTIPGPLHACG